LPTLDYTQPYFWFLKGAGIKINNRSRAGTTIEAATPQDCVNGLF